MNKMAEKIGDLSNTFKESNFHWTDKLPKCVYTHVYYAGTVLDTILFRLFESETVARFFIAKPSFAQKRYLDEVACKLDIDVPSPRSKVQTMGSSDDDGASDNEGNVDFSA